ncbi:hypothetical protein [Halomonas chromatireducens]|nr:hypothetical protein [Halomonas chromatireducens]
MGHHEKEEQQDKAGPAHEVETLLAALADAGRDLGPALAHRLRETLAPLSRQVRAELVAVIDDAFEVAPDLMTARQQARRLLRNAKALEAAQAVWPAYPERPAPVVNVEPLAPWLAHIDRHCELVADDRRYLLHHLSGRPQVEAMRLAHRYVEAWAAAADAESQAHRRANAGRRAANAMLRGTTP